MSYEDDANELDERWEDSRHFSGFSHDGILSSDAEDYFEGFPRILFLLKEARTCFTWIRGGDYTSTSPSERGPFWKRLGMWTYILDTLADGGDPSLDEFYEEHNNGGYGLANVAYINIKKEPGGSFCPWSQLKYAARRDCHFINEQIDLLDPQIIVCGSTYQVYSDLVCDGDIPSGPQCEPVWDDYNGRIVIDWCHPTFRGSDNGNFWKFVHYCQRRGDLFKNL